MRYLIGTATLILALFVPLPHLQSAPALYCDAPTISASTKCWEEMETWYE